MIDWRALTVILGLVVAATFSGWLLSTSAPLTTPATGDPKPRIVSLSPAITETIFALGAGGQMIRRTDYCKFPAEALALESVGPGLSPDLEAIARARPSLILAESTNTTESSQLDALADTKVLPWLTLDDLRESIPHLGELTGQQDAARDLVQRLEQGLQTPPPIDAPRVLVLLGIDGNDESLWFVKQNSLHGLALNAAGARNAIDEPTTGAPSISIERLLAINPDIIIGMTSTENPSAEAIKRFKERFFEASDAKSERNESHRGPLRTRDLQHGPLTTRSCRALSNHHRRNLQRERTMTEALTVRKLCLRAGQNTLLDAVNLTVKPGDFLAIVGPNGAGKSTLLKAILGLKSPTSGHIHIGDTSVHEMSGRTRAAYLGWLPQHGLVREAIPVEELIIAARFRFNEGRAKALAEATKALQHVGALSLRQRSVLTLSGGESQRVAMAVLLAQQAQYLLIDEPANHLDPAKQRQTYRRLGERWLAGQSILCVTYDVNLLGTIPAPREKPIRILGMSNGKVAFETDYSDAALPDDLGQLFDVHFEAITANGSRHLIISGDAQ